MNERPTAIVTFETLCMASAAVIVGFAAWFTFTRHVPAAKPAPADVQSSLPEIHAAVIVTEDMILCMPYILALLITRKGSRIAVWALYFWVVFLVLTSLGGFKSGFFTAAFAQSFVSAVLLILALVALNSPESRKWRSRHQP